MECSFCGKTIPKGTGMLYVKTDGTLLWFCSSKCRKYMLKYKKDPKKLKWTSSYMGNR
ncbi:50S ribosomal protein L24e [Sulfuracidifex tepidarius]|nr:50S ribosomal protein L24e [Sulfuracidifex tepidarius]